MTPIIKEAAKRAGGVPALATQIGVSRQAIYQWKDIPVDKVDIVARETGLSRSALRPDVFGGDQPASSLYEADFAAWAVRQASLLREGKFGALDPSNLADEIEDMARSQKRAISSHEIQLLCHLLKWEFQPGKRTPSWEATIFEQRRQIQKHLADSPSLKAFAVQTLDDEYSAAARLAGIETGLGVKRFPLRCPYTIDQVLDSDFLPSADQESER